MLRRSARESRPVDPDKIHHIQRSFGRQRTARRALGSERVELRPLIRRKKLDRSEHLRPFIGPSCSFTSSNELGLFVTLPLSSLVSIEPTDPHDIPPLLRILNDRQDLRRRASRLIAHGGRVAPASRELLPVAIAVTLDSSRMASKAVSPA